MTQQYVDEVSRGERFEFGKNWAAFLENSDDSAEAPDEEGGVVH